MASEAKPGKPAARKAAAAVVSTSANGDGSRFNATDEKALEAIVDALTAARDGDFTVACPRAGATSIGDVQTRVNELVEQNPRMTKELQRLARVVGRDGRMTERAALPGAYGGWADKVEAVNSLVDDLVRPTTEVGRVIAAVAQGDLCQKMALTIEGQPVKGEFTPHRPDRERDGRPARLASPTRSRASRARWAPTASSAARPRSRASAAPGGT